MRVCDEEGCSAKHYGKGKCKPHYDQKIRGRSVRFHLQDVPDGHRWCPGCKKAVPEEDYGRNAARSSGFATACKSCVSERTRQKYRQNGGFSESRKQRALENRRRYRRELLAAYGGKCACCDEDWEPYLELDHVNGDGALHRQTVPHVWSDLRKRGYPKDGYQLLCANCHAAKTKNKPCKHAQQGFEEG